MSSNKHEMTMSFEFLKRMFSILDLYTETGLTEGLRIRLNDLYNIYPNCFPYFVKVSTRNRENKYSVKDLEFINTYVKPKIGTPYNA